MSKEEIIDIAMIASIISANNFELIYEGTNIGSMGVHEWIVNVAYKFHTKTKHITDWEEESEKRGVSCWDDCVLQFAEKEFNLVQTK